MLTASFDPMRSGHTMQLPARPGAGSAWSGVQQLEKNSAKIGAFDPQIAMDANGDALAVWSQSDGMRFHIYTNRYCARTGWGTTQKMEAGHSGDALAPQIAMDASGDALVVWQQADGTRFNILAIRYSAGMGWGQPMQIESEGAGSAFYPQIAMDAQGHALAVWEQCDGVRRSIWASHYMADFGWSQAQPIQTNPSGDAYFPRVVMYADGQGLAVWTQSNGKRYKIWNNRYDPRAGWGMAQQVQTEQAGDAMAPQIAFDTKGRAQAVWYQFDGERYNFQANALHDA